MYIVASILHPSTHMYAIQNKNEYRLLFFGFNSLASIIYYMYDKSVDLYIGWVYL